MDAAVFHMSDDAYIRRFDLAKLTEMYVRQMEEAQPQTQADANRASLDFFRYIATGTAIRGLSWTQIRGNEIYMECYVHLFTRVCTDLQPRSRQDWVDVCTFAVRDVPPAIVDTVLDAYLVRKTRFRGVARNPAEVEPKQIPDQIADTAHWFVIYFKHMWAIELVERVFAGQQTQAPFDRPALASNITAALETADIPGKKFTPVQVKLAADKLDTYNSSAFTAELLYLVTELQ